MKTKNGESPRWCSRSRNHKYHKHHKSQSGQGIKKTYVLSHLTSCGGSKLKWVQSGTLVFVNFLEEKTIMAVDMIEYHCSISPNGALEKQLDYIEHINDFPALGFRWFFWKQE